MIFLSFLLWKWIPTIFRSNLSTLQVVPSVRLNLLIDKSTVNASDKWKEDVNSDSDADEHSLRRMQTLSNIEFCGAQPDQRETNLFMSSIVLSQPKTITQLLFAHENHFTRFLAIIYSKTSAKATACLRFWIHTRALPKFTYDQFKEQRTPNEDFYSKKLKISANIRKCSQLLTPLGTIE